MRCLVPRSLRLFSTLSLHKDVLHAFERNFTQIQTPSAIQRLAIPHLVQGKSAILTAETGSGKTLAYLLPILSRLYADPASWKEGQILLLTPSKHLQIQLSQVLLSLSQHLPHAPTFAMIPRPVGIPHVKDAPISPIHISSPVLLHNTYYKPQDLASYLSNITTICIDESDLAIAKDGGTEILRDLRAALKRNGRLSETQFVFVAATLPPIKTDRNRTPRAAMERLVPGIVTISTDDIHATRSGLTERFVRVEDGLAAKFDVLLGLVAASGPQQILLFANTPQRTEQVYNALLQAVPALAKDGVAVSVDLIHGKMPRHDRIDRILQLSCEQPRPGVHVIVCSDVAARGVDFRWVDTVLHFDFPREGSEYIHRTGRTCRGARTEGTSVGLVTAADERLAGLIEDASRGVRSRRLDNHNLFLKENEESEKLPLTGIFSRKRSFSK